MLSIIKYLLNILFQSLLRSPDKSPTDFNTESSDFTTPNKSLDDLFGMDFASSTPLDKNDNSLEAKVTVPEVNVVTPTDVVAQVCEIQVTYIYALVIRKTQLNSIRQCLKVERQFVIGDYQNIF